MKKLLLAIALASAFSSPAFAAYPTVDTPTIRTSFRVPKAKRVIFVRPSRWTDYAAVQFDAACVYNGVYQAIDMLRYQGCHVDIINSVVFESANGSKLWREIGDTYQLAVIMNPRSDQSQEQRYINADSTNIQILVVGGMRSNGATAVADTAIRGFFDSAVLNFEALTNGTTNRYACLVPYTSTGLGTDTVWAKNLPTGRMLTDSAGGFRQVQTGISGVYRVLCPIDPGNKASAWGYTTTAADTHGTRMPGAAWATPHTAGSEASSTDSLARSGEYLGPIWKVRYTSGITATSPRDTWFYKFSTSSTTGVMNPALMWACISRFVDVPPIKWALDWDDVTDINDSANYPRWLATSADSTLARLRSVGVVPTVGINPLAVPGYINGYTPATETQPYAAGSDSVPWGGKPAHTYLRGLAWFHHSHDSTQSSISSNLVGGYGGYAPSNGAVAVGGGQGGRRFASRYNPGQTNPGNFMGAGGHFGIVQRLAYYDSVRKVERGGPRAPYIAFPANQMLPVNWKTRANATGYSNQIQADTASCPIDSVLWAFDYGINGEEGTERKKLWLRSGGIGGGPRKEALWADRDSFVAQTLSQYPRSRYTVHASGRYIQANIFASFLQGVGARSAIIDACNIRAANLLGLQNKVNHAEYHNAQYGETFNSDANLQMNFTALGGTRDFPARQSTRILYQHPGQYTSIVTSSGDMHTEIFLTGIHSTFRAMDAIAGKKTQICVPAWHVYSR